MTGSGKIPGRVISYDSNCAICNEYRRCVLFPRIAEAICMECIAEMAFIADGFAQEPRAVACEPRYYENKDK